MNILIPHSWLLEHLETDASAEDIQRIVSLSGPSIERIYDREGEPVYDIEVTTNRVDAMSVRGIARECAVILQHAGVNAKLKELSKKSVQFNGDAFPQPHVVNDPKFCKRVLFVILKNVNHSATPDWMAKRLKQVEMNVHDAIIDTTNYITHELGHPCHAFDYDKIMQTGGKIIVKEAENGKKFKTLDDVEYETIGGEIVFENEAGEIIDLPAIKGTANTAIDDNTKNVLFWVESLDPKKVRYGSMKHAIRTVAAQLNEKDVDPELGLEVLERGVELYQQLCNAEVASPLFDEFPGKRNFSSVQVQKRTIDIYLGVSLESQTIQSILTELGCQVEVNGETFTVTPPSFRPDLKIQADFVEEIARIHGYHNLPSVIMDTPIPLKKPTDVNFALENTMKHFLSDIGWQEVYTYSMISEAFAQESGYPIEEHLKLQNPLTDDKVYLRNALWPSLNQVIDENPTEKELSVFEIANVYRKQPEGLPVEMLLLGMVSSRAFREVKGDLETLLSRLYITTFIQELNDPQIPAIAQSSILKTVVNGDEVQLGTIAVLKNGRTVIQLGISNLMSVVKNHPTYQPIPQTAHIIEDLTFTLPNESLIGVLVAEMKKVSSQIEFVEFKDIYKQNATFTVSYLDRTKNLSGADIEPIRKEIVNLMKTKYNAQLVGTIA